MAPKKRRADILKEVKEQGKADTTQEKIHLYDRMITGKATARELVRLSLLRGMITVEQYADFLEIEKNYPKDG
jgi:hypothetical protein